MVVLTAGKDVCGVHAALKPLKSTRSTALQRRSVVGLLEAMRPFETWSTTYKIFADSRLLDCFNIPRRLVHSFHPLNKRHRRLWCPDQGH